MKQIRNNVTYTDDLLDLEQLEFKHKHTLNPAYSSYNDYGGQNEEQMQRLVSGSAKQAAINMRDERAKMIVDDPVTPRFFVRPPNVHYQPQPASHISHPYSNYPGNAHYAQFSPHMQATPNDHSACVEFMNHVKNCPVCYKLHNIDKSVYYIIIIVLVVLLAILLKRLLEK